MRVSEINSRRPWKHYEGKSRECVLSWGNEVVVGIAECGIVLTGKTRTFHGYFCALVHPSGTQWIAESRSSLRSALRAVASAVDADGGALCAVGLNDDFFETGLSANTGLGYHPEFSQAVHMLDALPVREVISSQL